MIQMRRDGLTNTQIAKHYGIAAPTVAGIFAAAKRAGLEIPPNPYTPEPPKATRFGK